MAYLADEPVGIMGRLGNFFGVGPEQQQAAQQFGPGYMSPQAMAWGQALNNIAAMNMGQAPNVSPIQAYQQGVLSNARVQQQRQAAQRQAMASLPSSYREYQLAKAQGFDGTFEDWQTRTARSGVPAGIQEYEYLQGLPPEERESYLATKWRPNVVKVGDVPGVIGPDGAWTPVMQDMSQEDVAKLVAQQQAEAAGLTTAAEETEKFSMAQVRQAFDETWANQQGYGIAQNLRDVSKNYLDMLEGGQLDTGMINAFLLNVFGIGSEELAAMQADEVEQMLNNLQVVNLAPVTVQELVTIAKLWASAARQETPNKGVLRRAMNKADSLMEKIEADTLMQGRRIQEYRPGEFDRMRRINPFVDRLWTEEERRNEEIDIEGVD